MSTIRLTPPDASLGETVARARWARALDVPAVWLGAVVAVSTVVRGLVSVAVSAPTMVPDEVVYSDLAKSIAAGGFPSVRGVHELGWGVVYQALIAPAWVVFDDPVQAYHAALIVNALLMSLAAVPAYFLARMFVSERASIVVAVATVLVPSMSYTGLVLTENACYPALVLALLLVARALRSASLANQAVALLALGLVSLTRIQGIALAGGYLVAIATYAATQPPGRRRPYLRRFLPTAAATVVVSLSPMLLSLARGDGALGWLGVRSGTFDAFHPGEVPRWFVFLIAGLVLYVAVIPVAATAVLCGLGLRGRAQERVRLFAALALPTLVVMLVSVAIVSASIDVDGTENLNERYLFYVVPLLFVGLALWVEEALPRPRPWAWGVVLASAALVLALPIERLVFNSGLQSTALLPWVALPISGLALASVAAAFALGCGYLWLRCRSSEVGRLWVVVLAVMVIAGGAAQSTHAGAVSSAAKPFEGLRANWVDASLPAGADLVVLWDQRVAARDVKDPVYSWLMVTELFNKRVDRVMRIGPETFYEEFLPTVPVRFRPDSTLADRQTGRVLDARYALVNCRTEVAGKVVAQSPHGVLRLMEVSRPLRITRSGSCESRGE